MVLNEKFGVITANSCDQWINEIQTYLEGVFPKYDLGSVSVERKLCQT